MRGGGRLCPQPATSEFWFQTSEFWEQTSGNAEAAALDTGNRHININHFYGLLYLTAQYATIVLCIIRRCAVRVLYCTARHCTTVPVHVQPGGVVLANNSERPNTQYIRL